jgi:hypothetical protein
MKGEIMAASVRDAEAARAVVEDAVALLRWCASPEALVETRRDRFASVMPKRLLGLYRETVGQFETAYFELAILTLRGENPRFPLKEVLELLDQVGWTGPALDFKLAVLDEAGRNDVVVATAPGGVRRMRSRVFRRFIETLNVALGSLEGVPGVAAIRELKDFVERT